MNAMEKLAKPEWGDFSEPPKGHKDDGSFFFLLFFMEEESSPKDPVLDMHRRTTNQEAWEGIMYNVEVMWDLEYEIRRRKAGTFFGKDRYELGICIRLEVPKRTKKPRTPLEKLGEYGLAPSVCRLIGEKFDPSVRFYSSAFH